jgi:predicted nucleotidyltransferase component of viral defense system
VTKRKPTKLGVSVSARLSKLARERRDDFQLVLLRYANERLLYRLAQSPHADSFVLKGATLFTVWTGRPHRATRDIDLLGFGDATEAHVHDVFADVLALEVPDDGVTFDVATMSVSPIREAQGYGGVRVLLVAHIATARLRLQIDIGFGDAITPAATFVDFPALLDFPAPHLRAYPRETVVAEKLEAMVQLGVSNSRMKDFYDVALLARNFDFDGELLSRAVQATFERRGTPLPLDTPVAFTAAFVNEPSKRTQWSGFARKANVSDMGTLDEAVSAVQKFLSEPLQSAARGRTFVRAWRAGGPWRVHDETAP